MTTLSREINPFMLMMDPQYVLSRIEHSERLERLHSRVCRPLDKPQLSGAQPGEQDAHDQAVEAQSMLAQGLDAADQVE